MPAEANILSRSELKTWLDQEKDLTLIEVLPQESFREFHIPGAINIPGDQLRNRIAEVAPNKDKTVVVYCASPSCTASDRAAELLVEMGYTDVHDYRGGKSHWKEGGLPVAEKEMATA